MAENLEAAANLATTLGIFLAVLVFVADRLDALRHRKDERRLRELDTYRELSGKYFEYLQFLLDHPDVSTTETEWSRRLNPEGPVKQTLVVQMAVNMIETAYFMYKGHRSAFRKAQWSGWFEYLKDWCAHPAFVAAWPQVIDQYDAQFQKEVRKAYGAVHKGAPAA